MATSKKSVGKILVNWAAVIVLVLSVIIFSLPKGSVHTWRVDSWLTDEYFSEKFVIDIEKNYLCSPKSEK